MKLKRRNEHIVMYDKEESIKLLEQDSRVRKIINEKYELTIMTRPVRLTPEKKGNVMLICPIGKYKIIIEKSQSGNYISSVEIERVGGTVSSFPKGLGYLEQWHTHHISEEMSPKICWGSAEEEYDILRRNCDWFWLAKMALDLVYDSEKEKDHARIYDYVVPFLQLKYALQVKNKVWERKLRLYIFKKFKRVRLEKWLSQ